MSESVLDSIPLIRQAREKEREAQITAWVQEQFKKARSARSVTERQWYLNMAFYYGRQNVQYIRSSTSSTNYRLFVPPAPPWRVRLVINKIRGIVRTEVSKTTSQKPIFTVVPETTEEEDILAARAAEQIFHSAYTNKELQTVVQQTAWWRSVCGNGFIKTWWDSGAIDVANEMTGDICIERIRPFNIIVPDLLEEDIEKQAWVIHAFTLTPEDAASTYGLDKVPEANVNATNDLMEDSFLNMVGGNQPIRNEVLVLECWIKPRGNKNFPKGALITIVGDKLAQIKDEYPYAHKEYPFAKLDHIITGKFYTESVITDLIAPQREYNRTRSQLVENKNLMAKPRFMSPKGSVDTHKITSEPGQNIEYTPGMNPPVPMEMPNMPTYVMQELEHLLNDMDDISGQHEISRGNTPPQVTAATAISYLQEQDDSKLGPTIESQEKAIRKIGRQYLALVHQYWTTERTVRVVGEDSYFDATVFKGDSIKGSKINKDVRVEAGSALSTSKAARQAVIIDAMKNGWLDPQIGMQRLEIGGLEKLYEELQLDTRQAQRENMKMMMGQPLSQTPGYEFAPNVYDNHNLHVEIHNRFRKTQQFEILPEEIKAIFQSHVELHQQAVMAQMMPNMPIDPNAVASPGQPGNNGAKPPIGPQPQPLGGLQ
jgi:hypothetical protein